MPTPRSQIIGQEARWLLDLDVGGQVFRIADRAVDVVKADGTTLRYADGLGAMSIQRQAGQGSAQTAALTVTTGLDWALLRSRGVAIEDGTGIVRRWYTGQPFEAADIIIQGALVGVEYGQQGEALILSIERPEWATSALLPPVDAVIDDATWPVDTSYSVPEESVGVTYPVIIGRPGDLSFEAATPGFGFTARSQPGSPAMLCEYDLGAAVWLASKLMIAGHEVAATTVTIHDLSDGTSEARPVQTTPDLLGRVVSYVDFVGTTTLRPFAGHEYWAEWSDTSGGGSLDRHRTGTMRDAGEVLEYYLRQVGEADVLGLQVDLGRQIGQRERLAGYQIDGYLNDSVSILEFVSRELAPILPLQYEDGGDGIYWRARRFALTATDAVAHLDADAGHVVRASTIRSTARAGIRNEYSLEYALIADGNFTRRMTLSADPDSSDARAVGSYLCRLSRSRYGLRPAPVVQTAWVLSDSTARRVLHWWATAFSLPYRSVVYEGDEWLDSIEVGDAITISDASVYLVTHPAEVVTKDVGGGLIRLGLELSDLPGITPRRTS